MCSLLSRLILLVTILQQAVGSSNNNAKIKQSNGYLRSNNKSSDKPRPTVRRNQGLFSYTAVGSVSNTVTSTSSSSLSHLNMVTQSSATTTSSTSTVQGVMTIYNGIQQTSSSSLLESVVVSLSDQNSQTIKSTVASSDGMWTLSDVEPGYYKLKFDVPYGFTLLGYNSNEIPVTIDSGDTVVSFNGMLASVSGAYTGFGSVSGKLVGVDTYSNVTIAISDQSGNSIATTVADSSGNFAFMNLVEGTYSIDVCTSSTGSTSMNITATTHVQVAVQSNQVTDVSFQPTVSNSQGEGAAAVSSNSVFSYRY